jgi:4-carboxymuconolactone decarboxylase
MRHVRSGLRPHQLGSEAFENPMFSRREAKSLRAALLSLALFTSATAQGLAQATPQEGSSVGGSRTERSQAKQKALLGDVLSASTTQPELMQILRNLTYGDVYAIGNLDDRTRELVTLVVLTTNQTLPQIKAHTHAALNVGVPPIEIREALYQVGAFIGFPKVINALEVVDEVLASRGIALPLEPKATVADHERFEKGRAIQQPIYGGRMRENLRDLPGSLPDDVSRLVTESFGDFYTREGLDIRTRELMIFCALATLGGTDRQLASHAEGNLKVGNSIETMASAMVQALPHVGFPRVLNALYAIKDVKVGAN